MFVQVLMMDVLCTVNADYTEIEGYLLWTNLSVFLKNSWPIILAIRLHAIAVFLPGTGKEVLSALLAEGQIFDLIFLDADKQSYMDYFKVRSHLVNDHSVQYSYKIGQEWR